MQEPALPSLDELIAIFTATELACIVGTWTPGSSLRSAIYDCLESLVALQASPNYRTMTFHSLLSNFSVIGQTNSTGDTIRSRLENYSLCSVASVAGMAAFSEGLRRFPLLLVRAQIYQSESQANVEIRRPLCVSHANLLQKTAAICIHRILCPRLTLWVALYMRFTLAETL